MTLDELQKLQNTRGPWPMINLANACYHLADGLGSPHTFDDARFIAATRDFLPYLIAIAQAAKVMRACPDCDLEGDGHGIRLVEAVDALTALEVP